MRGIKNGKEKITNLVISTILLVLISTSSFAIENFNYKIPNKIELSICNNSFVPKTITSNKSREKRFSLLDYLDLRVENQGITQECWAFSVLKVLETNIALENGRRELDNFSERHMDYATSKMFEDGINENGFSRNIGQGGLLVEGLAYLTNGQGAIPEQEMPFENNEKVMPIGSIDKKPNTVVNDYYVFPTINKKYICDSNGNTVSVRYFNADGYEYKTSDLNNVRNIIKDHLVNKGAIATMTAGSFQKYYNRNTKFESTAYNCNSENIERDHAFTIIGWDDEFSKDNFAEGSKPSTDGAYIVLNSYGSESFENGILYVSYEDYFIESEMYGIQSSVKLDYDKIYQTDFYGGIYQIGTEDIGTGYYGAVFQKDGEKNEIIDSIGVTLSDYSIIDIYINPNGSDMSYKDLRKVGSSGDVMTPGFHRIYVNPTNITGEEFAVVIKQQSLDNSFGIAIETPTDDSDYSIVKSNNNSYISEDGYNWQNLADMEVFGIDMKNTDVCIKVFSDYTDEEFINLSSEIYQVGEKYIKNIKYDTNIEEFKNNVVSNSETMKFNNTDGIICSGTELILSDDTKYTLIVRGDINGDGKVTLTDLSKILLHYNEVKGFSLRNTEFEAADLNLDGEVSLVDISQFLVLYNSI